MSIEEEQFKEHLKQVADAASKGNLESGFEERPLTLDELRELAMSMGLTADGWEELLIKGKTHLKAADDHLAARNFDQAIVEAQQAVGINPYIENGNAILAKAYLLLWLEDHNMEHCDKAEYHARKELAVDPKDQVAVQVLSTINKKRKTIHRESNSRNKIFIGIGVVALIVFLLFFFLNSPSRSSGNNNVDNSTTRSNNSGIEDQLIESEEDVYLKWDLVQVAISQRNNMIPDLFAAVETSNSEIDIINNSIGDLQDKIKASEGDERFALENELDTKIQELKNSVRKYGNQTATEKLLIQIEGSENRIAFEKKNYNEAVKHYNILVKKNKDEFPSYEVKPYFNEK